MVMVKDTKKLQVASCPTYSDFFERFCKGLHKQMGDIVHPDQARCHELMMEIMTNLEQEWAFAEGDERLHLALEGCFYIIGCTLALRGEEISLVELGGMHKHWRQATTHRKPHVVVTLLGRFKYEVGECYHMMPVLSITQRGLEPEKWVKRALDEYSQRHIVSGYMFRNPGWN
jgi:hypothetical protein